MKRVALFITIVFVMLFVGNITSFGATGKWFNPKVLKVYIPQKHPRTVMMEHAFQEWMKLTKDKFMFKFTPYQNVANIEVSFVDKIDPSLGAVDRAIGLTRYATIKNGQRLVHAQIWIANKTQDGRILSDDEVYTVMLHEIGHAMGLPHSSNPNSAMYPGVNVIQEVSQEDINILKERYGW